MKLAWLLLKLGDGVLGSLSHYSVCVSIITFLKKSLLLKSNFVS